MNEDQQLLERLAALPVKPRIGTVYRCMLAGASADCENIRGSRWNPQNISAIYTSLSREGAIAEIEYRLSLEPPIKRKTIRKAVYTIRVELEKTIDIYADALWMKFGVTNTMLAGIDHSVCQKIGAQVDWLELEGVVVPSARHAHGNLVIYPSNSGEKYKFEILDETVLVE